MRDIGFCSPSAERAAAKKPVSVRKSRQPVSRAMAASRVMVHLSVLLHESV